MAPTTPTTGALVAAAFEAAARPQGRVTGLGRPRTRREVFVGELLHGVLASPKARAVFARRIAGITDPVGEFRTGGRSGPAPADLVADVRDGSRLALALHVDGPVDPAEVTELLACLPGGASRLVVITPSTAESEPGIADERLVATTWARVARRLADKDPKRAERWALIGDVAEERAPRATGRVVSPRILLDEAVTAEMRAHLATFRLVAEHLFDRPARFAARRRGGAALEVGGRSGGLVAEFGAVEDGTPTWLVGARPTRAATLGLGALDDADRSRAEARLRAIASHPAWRTDPDRTPRVGEFLGAPATPALEAARSLLWEVLDPARLADSGFPLVARAQPDLTDERLAVRVAYPADPRAGTFLVSIGGSRTWKTLLPRVTREYDAKTYIVQAHKNDDTADLTAAVDAALRSLATKP